MSDTLQALRARIDALDEKIQALVSERAACAQEVAEVKRVSGEHNDCYRAEREAEVLRKVLERNHGPLSNEEIARLFREIISTCRALEQPLSIAYLGPQGTYSEAAALKHFGHAVTALPVANIDDIFRTVESGTANYGVVPVENSTEGSVSHTLDMLMVSPLRICGEVELRVHHQLLCKSGTLAGAQRVYAHPQALAQCRVWLDSHLPGVDLLPVSSNAEGARRAAQETGAAAIASDLAASIYQLQTLAMNIEDESNNTTRFLVLGKQDTMPSGHDKTSLLVSTRNQSGALHHLLQPLAQHEISMTRIESRPSRQAAWEYVFFIDIEGHMQEPAVAAALKEIQSDAALLKVLGSYPKAVL
ncbi:MAG: prephenate dehydratase [Gammaproteobacteria bacterium]|nr:prephenate dehydratase [Gammaproteobacteria bacterium]